MEKVAKLSAFFTLLILVAVPVQAQEHVTSDADLQRAVAERADTRDADREVLERLLERDEVRQIAEDAGLDVERAKDAVPQLDDGELARLASMARNAENGTPGGQTTITITSTAIIIALLVIIIVLVA